MKKLIAAFIISLLIPFQNFAGVSALEVSEIFTSEFRERITEALQSSEPTIFRTPTQGLDLYQSKAKLFGQLTVGKGEIVCSGLISIAGSLTKADKISLEAKQVIAQHAIFIIKSKNPSRPVLEVNDISITYDFDQKNAQIESLNKLERIILPNNQVSVGFEKMLWVFNEKNIEINADAHPLFVRSNNINHKGLGFDAKKITYLFHKRTLTIEGVDGIPVSNATIIPENGLVNMTEGAKIDTLRNAKVVLSDTKDSHALSTGDILIESKNKFDGIGHYELETYSGKKVMLQFRNFRQSSRNIEHGDGEKQISENIGESLIPANRSIEMFPEMMYHGKVLLSDYKNKFDLDGMISLDLGKPQRHWFKYNTIANKEINITSSMQGAEATQILHTGIFVCGNERELFASFIEPTNRDRIPLFLANGQLVFNPDRNTYEINKTTKVAGIKKTQKFHYHKKLKEIDFEGAINLGEESRYFSQRSSAIGSVNAENGSLSMNAMIVMDFKAPRKIFEHMIYTLDKHKLHHGAKPTNKKFFASQLYHVLSEEELNYIGSERPENIRLSEVLGGSMALTNIEMKWSAKDHAFHSVGRIGIANFFNMNVDANFNGFVYIPKRQNNHEIHVYFEVGDEWYYMRRKGDQLSFRSSKEDFNKMLNAKSGKYTLLSDTEANAMISKYKGGFKS